MPACIREPFCSMLTSTEPTERQKQYQEYLRSPEWARIKAEKERRSKKRCAICAVTIGIELHHLFYRKDLICELSDLRWLCDRCHETTHELIKAGKLSFPKPQNHNSCFALTKAAVKRALDAVGKNMFREPPPKCTLRFKENEDAYNIWSAIKSAIAKRRPLMAPWVNGGEVLGATKSFEIIVGFPPDQKQAYNACCRPNIGNLILEIAREVATLMERPNVSIAYVAYDGCLERARKRRYIPLPTESNSVQS